MKKSPIPGIIIWFAIAFALAGLAIFARGAEVTIPCHGISVHDGDTFYVEIPPGDISLPAGSTVDGTEQEKVTIPAFLVQVRLVDNHLHNKTLPLNAPEVHTPKNSIWKGRAQRGAIPARDRLKELVEDKDGNLIINTNLMKGNKDKEPSLVRILTMGRILADFESNDSKSTAGQTMFREGLVKVWSKK